MNRTETPHRIEVATAPETTTVVPGRLTLWALPFSALVLASTAVLIIVRNPRALGLAAVAGVLSLAIGWLYHRVRASAASGTRATSSVANAGIVIAGIAVAPLLVFAVLWLTLLLLIGVAWLLHVMNLA